MRPFKSPRKSFGDVDAKTAARLVSAATDVALILDDEGIVRDLSSNIPEETLDCGAWIGKSWVQLVTPESRGKIEVMLGGARVKSESSWHQVNHLVGANDDIPVLYQVMRLRAEGPILAIGRDLKAASQLQQKLVAAQSQLEREQSRVTQIETRYRALFNAAGEAILVADALTLEIVDANRAATKLFTRNGRGPVKRPLSDLFANADRKAITALLAEARTKPKTDPIDVRAHDASTKLRLSVGVFRNGERLQYFLHVSDGTGTSHGLQETETGPNLEALLAELPDGFVVLDADRRVVFANDAFVSMLQLADEDQVRDRPIDEWLGRVGVDVDVLFSSLDEQGAISRYTTMIRSAYGAELDIEVAGVATTAENHTMYGLLVRRDESRMDVGAGTAFPGEPQTVDKLKDLVGRTPLRDLVRQTTDIVERMCIQAALELTGNNRASAAEMLGLSRQSLYLKLRRHNIGGLGDEPLS